MQKVLVDSNIFLDYYLGRRGHMLPFGEFAFRFFEKALKCSYFIVVCKATLREVSDRLGISEEAMWEKVLKGLKEKNKIEVIEYSHELVKEAHILCKKKNVAFNDALFTKSLRQPMKANSHSA